jgi:serine/threonine protein kinase/tetratricopeptide (TPR) repeat protein
MTANNDAQGRVAPALGLGGSGSALDLEDPAVIRAVQEYLAALEEGRPPVRAEFLQRYPEIAPALAECLDALDFMNGAAAQFQRAGKGQADMAAGTPLGDFRIVREVGRGGMGVVYEAVQLSLGRRVALKVLPPAASLDPRHLQRFRHEAHAAAQLHHTNIVPVHSVGCERGVHFYAMQYIDGRTLAGVIDDLRRQAAGADGGAVPDPEATTPYAGVPPPSEVVARDASSASAATIEDRASEADTAELSPRPTAPGPEFFRTAAQWGIESAEALEHAHQLGVVHRDIKPGNLLVDGRGNLWVTDFGLAHIQGDCRLTMEGDLVGTLRYMSPEQALADGAAVDHRTDVYSLGATLYELLTLEPAFGGSDRRALLRQIAYEEPRPPRRRNRAIPAELETIVVKAMEKNPADRYATAQELADDLRRFLEDKPIRARRPSPAQRARKWARRHQAVVGTALVGLLLAVGVLAGAIGWVARDRTARQHEARRATLAAFELALQLQQDGKNAEALAAARRAEGLVRGAEGLAELHHRVLELVADLEMLKAIEEVRQAQATTKDNHFDQTVADVGYADAFQNYGIDVNALRVEEAGARLRGRAIRVQLAAALDNWAMARKAAMKPSWRRLLSVAREADRDDWRCRLRDAMVAGPRSDLPQRRRKEWRQQLVQDLRKLAASPDVDGQPASAVVILASHLRDNGDAETALRVLERAQRGNRGDFWINIELALALWNLRDPRNLGDPRVDEAVRYAMAAVAARPDIAGAQYNLGVMLYHKGDLDGAIASYRQAILLQSDYAEAHGNLALALCDAGRAEEAVASWNEVLRLKPNAAYAHHGLAMALASAGQFAAAKERMDQAYELGAKDPQWPGKSWPCLRFAEMLVELDPKSPRGQAGQARSADAYVQLAQVCPPMHLPAMAARAYARAFSLKPELVANPAAGHRYNAACAATLAGSGQVPDPSAATTDERARLRGQSLEWLRADLACWRQRLDLDPKGARADVVQQMGHWQTDPDLSGVRDPAGLARLTGPERSHWQRLWRGVAALRQTASQGD